MTEQTNYERAILLSIGNRQNPPNAKWAQVSALLAIADELRALNAILTRNGLGCRVRGRAAEEGEGEYSDS